MSPAKEQTVRVVCVDDSTLITQSLTVRLGMEPWIRVVRLLKRADALVEEAVRSRADVVLLDVDMPGRDPFDALAELRVRRPRARCIILSGHVRIDLLDRAVASGAWGYVSKSAGADALLEAIRGVHEGEFVLRADVLGEAG